jgi:hypothetical protein
VVKATKGANLERYVVAGDLRRDFDQAFDMIGHAVTTGRYQAAFPHRSFGSDNSHLLAVLREIW